MFSPFLASAHRARCPCKLKPCWHLPLRDCLAFCTEPVFASLSNVLGQWDNLPSPVPTDIKEYKLFDVETKYGLLQVRTQAC